MDLARKQWEDKLLDSLNEAKTDRKDKDIIKEVQSYIDVTKKVLGVKSFKVIQNEVLGKNKMHFGEVELVVKSPYISKVFLTPYDNTKTDRKLEVHIKTDNLEWFIRGGWERKPDAWAEDYPKSPKDFESYLKEAKKYLMDEISKGELRLINN